MKKAINSILFLIIVTCTISSVCAAAAVKARPVILSGHIQSKVNDSLTLYVWYDVLSDVKKYIAPYKVYKSALKNGTFYFKTAPLTDRAYISLSYGKISYGQPLAFFEDYIVSPGDKIFMQEVKRNGNWFKPELGDSICNNCSTFKFSGTGSAKLNCLWELDERQRVNFEKMDAMKDRGTSPYLSKKLKVTYRDMQILHEGDREVLARYKNELSPFIWQMIKADAIAKDQYYFYNSCIKMRGDEKMGSDSILLFRQFYSSKASEWERYDSISPDILLKSAWYSAMSVRRAGFLKSYIEPGLSRYELVKKYNNGLLRQQLIAKYLYDNTKIQSYDSLLNDALEVVKIPAYSDLLQNIKKNLFAGSPAYDFALPDSLGNIVRLSDFKGKVVFVDFFFTGCSSCADYFKHSISEAEDVFRNNKDVVFITISIDRKDVWYKGLQSGAYTSDKAINLYTEGQGNMHPIIKHYLVNSFPSPLLIGRNGRVISNDSAYLGFIANPSQLSNAIKKALIE